MNFSPINHRTKRAFTLTEVMVSMALVGVVGMVLFSVMVSTMRLSSQNAVTNLSNFRTRQTLDRLGEIARYAQDTPVLITSNGTPATGTTADGFLAKNALGGPYVFTNANGQADAEIPAEAMSFVVEFAPSAGGAAPVVGDYFSLDLSTQPQLEVVSVGTPSVSGPISRVLITTKQAIGEIAKPGSYTVSASRYRKEAYIFVQSGSYWELRHFSRVVAATNFSNPLGYRVLGTGFQKLGTQPFFTTTTDNGTQSTWLRAVARSSSRAEYTEARNGKNTLTAMPVQVKLWNYNAPPPPAS